MLKHVSSRSYYFSKKKNISSPFFVIIVIFILFLTKYRYVYIQDFCNIVQPTVFMKNNFNLTCYNTLKNVKYTIFHENLTVLEEFSIIGRESIISIKGNS